MATSEERVAAAIAILRQMAVSLRKVEAEQLNLATKLHANLAAVIRHLRAIESSDVSGPLRALDALDHTAAKTTSEIKDTLDRLALLAERAADKSQI